MTTVSSAEKPPASAIDRHLSGIIARPRSTWLRNYVDPVSIRRRGAFWMTSCLTADRDARLIIHASPNASPLRCGSRLDELVATHQHLAHPLLPRVMERTRADGVEMVALESDAFLDGEQLIARLVEREKRLPYAAVEAMLDALWDLLGHAREALPGTAALGALSLGNLVFGPSGRFCFVGLGANLITELDTGAAAGELGAVIPEAVAAGRQPDLGTDVAAVALLERRLRAYLHLPRSLAEVYRGERDEDELTDAVRSFDALIDRLARGERITDPLPRVVALRTEIRRIVGESAEPRTLHHFVRELISSPAHLGNRAEPGSTLALGPDAGWMRPPSGPRIDLGSHLVLRRLLLALVALHETGETKSLSVRELCEHGWPNEQMTSEAGANRVYVAIATLRKLGLRGLLQRHQRGYRIDPALRILRADDGARQ